MRRTSEIGSRGRSFGFTLIELLVVIAILVLISTAIPLVLDHALPERRVAVAADRLVTAIHAAQATSIATGKPSAIVLPGEVRITDPDGRGLDAVYMFPDGSANAARFEIRDGDHRRAVVVSGLTGRVKLERPR
jgi:general secretion pathway protein H